MELSIQERLKDLRVKRGLTLDQLAGQTHLSKSALGSHGDEGDSFSSRVYQEPAVSNAVALPAGNGIFTATWTERITHNTLRCNVVCQMGRRPLCPHNKPARCLLCREHSAGCCQQPVSRSVCSFFQTGLTFC